MKARKGLIGIILMLLLFTVSASAKEIGIKNGVSYNKVWTIKLTHDIDWKTINNGVYVIDSKGVKQKIKIALGNEANTIVVLPPSEGYKPLQTYTMLINNNLKTRTGTNLKEDASLKFTISSTAPIKKDPYDSTFAEVIVKSLYEDKNITMGIKGLIIDNKVITTYSAIDKADTAFITTKDGERHDVQGVYWYDKAKNIAVLKINSYSLPSANIEKIDEIQIENVSLDKNEIEEILNNYSYKSLLQVKKENYSNMNLSSLEDYIWKKYSHYKIDKYPIFFNNILVMQNEKDNNMIDIYLAMGEGYFKNFWSFTQENIDYKEKIEKMLEYVYDDASNQFPDKNINMKIICDYRSSSNIANFENEDTIFNSTFKVWDIKADIVNYTIMQGNKYSLWNEKFQ